MLQYSSYGNTAELKTAELCKKSIKVRIKYRFVHYSEGLDNHLVLMTEEPFLPLKQEQEIGNMVVENNAITQRFRVQILENNGVFQNTSVFCKQLYNRVLKRHQMDMRQFYKVPFERNCDRVKELRYQYVQVMQW